MNIEEQSKLMETNSMMRAIGFEQISTDEKPDGIYITYVLPKIIKTTNAQNDELIIPGAQ